MAGSAYDGGARNGEMVGTGVMEQNGAGARPLILAICSRKGGVAKTTTATNLSVVFAALGYRVALVDLDSQADATRTVRGDDSARHGAYELAVGAVPFDAVRIHTGYPNLVVIPATSTLNLADMDDAGLVAREEVFRAAFMQTEAPPQIVLLDCPPALTAVTLNALAVSDAVVIPVTPTPSGFDGLVRTWEAIGQVQRRLLGAASVVLIGAIPGEVTTRAMIDRVGRQFGGVLMPTQVPPDARVEEAAFRNLPVVVYDPEAPASAAYRALAVDLTVRLASLPEVPPLPPFSRQPDQLPAVLQAWRDSQPEPDPVLEPPPPEPAPQPEAEMAPARAQPPVKVRTLALVALFFLSVILLMVLTPEAVVDVLLDPRLLIDMAQELARALGAMLGLL